MPASPESGQASKKPLAPMLVGLAMFLFFPLGLYLLWSHPTLGKNAKWWGAGIVWGLMVMVMASREEKQNAIDATPKEKQTTRTNASNAPIPSTAPQPTGKTFSERQMADLYRKASKLRLGMSAVEAIGIMGQPTKQWINDPMEYANIPGVRIADTRPTISYSWCSSKDPGNELISIYLKDDEAYWIAADKNGTTIIDLKR